MYLFITEFVPYIFCVLTPCQMYSLQTFFLFCILFLCSVDYFPCCGEVFHLTSHLSTFGFVASDFWGLIPNSSSILMF
jgi:hypothetical protein